MHAPMAEMVAPVRAERLIGHTQTWNLTSLPGNMHHFLPLNLLFYPNDEGTRFPSKLLQYSPTSHVVSSHRNMITIFLQTVQEMECCYIPEIGIGGLFLFMLNSSGASFMAGFSILCCICCMCICCWCVPGGAGCGGCPVIMGPGMYPWGISGPGTGIP